LSHGVAGVMYVIKSSLLVTTPASRLSVQFLPILRTNEVFVAGSQPTITYNPRDERHLERAVPLRVYFDAALGDARLADNAAMLG
jgi:hypothetical protein